jgi:quinol monooxygenase YgiN
MTVTELAILKLKSETEISSLALHSALKDAKDAMEHFNNAPGSFHWFQEIEEPTRIYLIGEWQSAAVHFESWIPSPENKRLIELTGSLLDVETMFHINTPQSSLIDALKGPVVAVGRHTILPEMQEEFEQTFSEKKVYLEKVMGPGTFGFGWRIEKEEGKEEFVLIGAWESVDAHVAFANTEEFKEYAKIRPFIDGFVAKHVKKFDV